MSYIYFIQVRDNGPVKIGTTVGDPRKRMRNLQTGCPLPVDLLVAIKGTPSQEKQIHLVLSRFRIQGEWFEPHPIVVAAVATAIEVGEAVATRKKEPKHSHPICKWRSDNGVTLEQLANRIGVQKAALSRIERGNRQGSLETVRRLAEVTGIPAKHLRPDLYSIMNEGAA